jgi:hypothetical protein
VTEPEQEADARQGGYTGQGGRRRLGKEHGAGKLSTLQPSGAAAHQSAMDGKHGLHGADI